MQVDTSIEVVFTLPSNSGLAFRALHDKRRDMRLLLFFGLCFALASTVSAKEVTEEQILANAKEVSDEEFLRTVRDGAVIQKRMITTHQLQSALDWASDAKANGSWLGDTLTLEECVFDQELKIEGSIAVGIVAKKCVFNGRVNLFASWEAGFRCEACFFRHSVVIAKQPYFGHGEIQPRSSILPHIGGVGLGFKATVFYSTVHVDALIDGPLFIGEKSIFHKAVTFMGKWRGQALIERCLFHGVTVLRPDVYVRASISESHFHYPILFVPTDTGRGIWELLLTTFEEEANFSGLTSGGSGKLKVTRCTFKRDAIFSHLRGGIVEFEGTEFQGRSYFRLVEVDEFYARPSIVTGTIGRPCIFGGRAVFHELRAKQADFQQAEFRGFADFSRARIGSARFTSATFEGDANFNGIEIGERIMIGGARFQDRLTLSWRLLVNHERRWPWQESVMKLEADKASTFENLKRAYERSGNTRGKNEAFYHERRLSRPHGAERWLWWVDRCFWGFGVRPWRVAAWMVVLFAAFTAGYLSNVPRHRMGEFKYHLADGVLMASRRSASLPSWHRLWVAAAFSARTAWHFGYGPEHSRGALWKTITTGQMLGFKVMAILLLKAMANTSPVLNDLAGKLIPI
ncbi:MAG: pentapeptide repeat-containing protein [Verrucomicrobiota bacterium]|nr:pentapeptide repeat-containing protein [Verrucomicrobiota bacterium]